MQQTCNSTKYGDNTIDQIFEQRNFEENEHKTETFT